MKRPNRLWGLLALVIAVPMLLANSSCDTPENRQTPPSAQQQQSQRAREAASNVRFSGNAEIENITRRLEMVSNPNLLGYIVLFNQAGQPVTYHAVRGKVTSSTKRLTPQQTIRTFGNGNGGSTPAVINAPSDDGTFGGSDDYIYFWTTEGQYIQWSGQYLYSDRPIRLRIEPLVITTVNEQPH